MLLTEPGLHFEQTVAPLAELYVPGEHAMHDADLTSYDVPAAHSWHVKLPPDACGTYPTAHVQFWIATEPATDTELAGHAVQFMPSPRAYVLAGQSVQLVAPTAGAIEPS